MSRLLRTKVKGFTMIEILVAMVVLAIGLLGMAGMTVLVMRGNRTSVDMTAATNICQRKIEELKDVEWMSLGTATTTDTVDVRNEMGLEAGGMVIQGKVDYGEGLNSQGLTKQEFFNNQKTLAGTECQQHDSSVLNWQDATTCSTNETCCMKEIEDAGPYKFARTFVVCKGTDAGQTPAVWTSSVTTPSNPPTGSVRGNFEVDCRVPDLRSNWLTCNDSDITTGGGASNKEKKIKVLCAWRGQEGSCHSVHLETTRVEF
jgi:prepilin-type N-terminal cleavage/methylation domain-containing protein